MPAGPFGKFPWKWPSTIHHTHYKMLSATTPPQTTSPPSLPITLLMEEASAIYLRPHPSFNGKATENPFGPGEGLAEGSDSSTNCVEPNRSPCLVGTARSEWGKHSEASLFSTPRETPQPLTRSSSVQVPQPHLQGSVRSTLLPLPI